MPKSQPTIDKKRAIFLGIYVALAIGSFVLAITDVYNVGFIGIGLLCILGLPWSFIVIIFGWLIIHTGSSNALEWLLLLSTVPNIVLILRSILLKFVKESIEV